MAQFLEKNKVCGWCMWVILHGLCGIWQT